MLAASGRYCSDPKEPGMREWEGGVVPSASPSGGNMSNKVSSLIILAAASIALTFGFAGCNKTDIAENGAQSQPAQADQSQAATDNLAPTDGTQATGANAQQQPVSQAQQQSYQQPAPVQQRASRRQYYSNSGYE